MDRSQHGALSPVLLYQSEAYSPTNPTAPDSPSPSSIELSHKSHKESLIISNQSNHLSSEAAEARAASASHSTLGLTSSLGSGAALPLPIPSSPLESKIVEYLENNSKLSERIRALSSSKADFDSYEGHKSPFVTKLPIGSLIARGSTSLSPASLPAELFQSKAFHNWNATEEMLSVLGFSDSVSIINHNRKEGFSKFDFYDQIRREQNLTWARSIVQQGVALAKNKHFKEAMAKYDEALLIDSQNVEALVAKGAAKFNLGELAVAKVLFEEALRHQPDDANAKKYLSVVEEKIAQEKERLIRLEEEEKKRKEDLERILMEKEEKEKKDKAYREMINKKLDSSDEEYQRAKQRPKEREIAMEKEIKDKERDRKDRKERRKKEKNEKRKSKVNEKGKKDRKHKEKGKGRDKSRRLSSEPIEISESDEFSDAALSFSSSEDERRAPKRHRDKDRDSASSSESREKKRRRDRD